MVFFFIFHFIPFPNHVVDYTEFECFRTCINNTVLMCLFFILNILFSYIFQSFCVCGFFLYDSRILSNIL